MPEGESRLKDASVFNVLNFLLRSNQFLSFFCIYHIICHSLGSLRCNLYRFLIAKHDDEISWQKKHDDKIRTQICCHHVESYCGLSLVLHLFILASVHMTIVRLMYLEFFSRRCISNIATAILSRDLELSQPSLGHVMHCSHRQISDIGSIVRSNQCS